MKERWRQRGLIGAICLGILLSSFAGTTGARATAGRDRVAGKPEEVGLSSIWNDISRRNGWPGLRD